MTHTIRDLLRSVAALVDEREIIDHGSIRCLYSQSAVDSICEAEGCDEVEVGRIGSSDLCERLLDFAEDPAGLYLSDLVALERAYQGADIQDYLDEENEDELRALERLIEAAEAL
jgi:hypothetical protein